MFQKSILVYDHSSYGILLQTSFKVPILLFATCHYQYKFHLKSQFDCSILFVYVSLILIY
jgi:hypothetical protein